MSNAKRAESLFACPFCGGALECTTKVDCDIDLETGVVTDAGTGGAFEVYCENSCKEWLNKGGLEEGMDHDGWPSAEDIKSYVNFIKEQQQ